MAAFRDLSIHRKLTVGMTFIAGVALLLSALAALGYGAYAFRVSKASQLGTLADVVGRNSQAALAFNDPHAAGQILDSLKAIHGLDRACVYDATGMPFAAFPEGAKAPLPRAPSAERTDFEGGRLVVVRQVRRGEELLGWVYLQEDLGDLRTALRWNILFNLILLITLGLLVLWISFRMQRYVTAPLLDLAQVARRVSEEEDYTVRAREGGRDEIGSLVEAFNSMLSQIQRRDDQLLEYREHLEDQVATRTEELLHSNRELLLAKQKAEEVSRAKSAFLANMSHELRTPLNAILLYTELLEEDAREQGRASELIDLQRIRGAASHLLTLINDILDLSKIEAGRMSLSLEPLDPRVLVEESLETIRPLADKSGNALAGRLAPDLATFIGDPTKLRQALFNLLSNACKFTENGSVSLEADFLPREGARWIRLRVRDTGIGMSTEQQERVFQEFTQAEESTSRRYGGTGLGLTLCRRLCQLMGGDVSVESSLGSGSTFTIEIPAPPPGRQGGEADHA
ncbi:MAG TPA: ATP-binding protein [Holophagaceae bacterium]|nr:ATP-binding protein [Holophagaceae bacterium]